LVDNLKGFIFVLELNNNQKTIYYENSYIKRIRNVKRHL